MFKAVIGFKKEDLIVVAKEIGETVPTKTTVSELKNIIVNSREYLQDPDFVTSVLVNTIADRKLKYEEEQRKLQYEEEQRKLQFEAEQRKLQYEEEQRKLQYEADEKREKRQFELELARIQAQTATLSQNETQPQLQDTNGVKKKFHLPKLEFRVFSGDLKDWLSFWSQFEHIHQDPEIAPENKFQYLVQATVNGSRAREVVESFPPTGANYEKAVESLKARFGREDLLVEVYVRELLKLIISVQKNEKFLMTSLYDKLESYLRALETLGVTTDKCASILYPMVESCFPEEFLRAWNRYPRSSSSADAKERLTNLMHFFKTEVEGEERINLAMAGFGLSEKSKSNAPVLKKKQLPIGRGKIPTAANLLATSAKDSKKSCVFCSGTHSSADCFSAQKMSLADRLNVLKEKNCCFACLNPGHSIRKCRIFLKCIVCGKKHVPLLCEALETRKHEPQITEQKEATNDVNMSNINFGPEVFLQTLKVKLISDKKEVIARVILDSGSQRSYILKSLAEEMGYPPMGKEMLVHSLFGGVKSEKFEHTRYRIRMRNLMNNFTCNFEALDQLAICNDVTPVNPGPWMENLHKMSITLSDVGDKPKPVQILIGADLYGKFLTGQRRVLSSGLVAIETSLGWTLSGKVPGKNCSSSNAMLVTSLFVKELDISELWKLDSIGIKDPIEKLSKREQEDLTIEHFLQSVRYNENQRYEVHLPWLDNCAPLPDNFELAERRLESTTKKLIHEGLYNEYDKIFLEWLNEGIIEEVPGNDINLPGNYLPHRPVIKESSSTTPIRPVFDASARIKGHPSLNDSLHSGPNLIELIPDILLRFREKKIGVTADIRKAFLQISICKKDRDFLRFLWWTNKNCQVHRVFRHARVVFGVRSSPFLLEAVLKYHLDKNSDVDPFVTKCLSKSFYVDNLVASVHDELELKRLIDVSNDLLKKAGFELQDWECSQSQEVDYKITNLLGLQWYKSEDILSINLKWLDDINIDNITKRTMLSITHKVFDPFGFATPVMLCPKIMLQKTWKLSLGWDEEITGSLREEFIQWFTELNALKAVRVPRWISFSPDIKKKCSIHTFCDASKDAYAAVTYLVHEGKDRNVHFLTSKSRIAPLKCATIPRLELLAALMGARLTKSILDALGWTDIECFYWTDSTTVLTWITKEENWSVFVYNRVKEIRRISQPTSWRHISGVENPADLPSRGCKANYFVRTRWWEGPEWLSEFHDEGPSENLTQNEDEILKERKKSTVSATASANQEPSSDWFHQRFSKYEDMVRLIGWIMRFIQNCRSTKEKRNLGELAASEFSKAELTIFRIVQKETFEGDSDKKLKSLAVYKDENDLLRVKTSIIYRKDAESFRKPILLPSEHEVVSKLIRFHHEKNSHCGVQILLNILRENYWILRGRKSIKRIISSCVICKRYSSKKLECVPAPLPENRVRDAAVFQITGIDTAGPLFLRGKQKVWILLFTCAIFRAVHLELVSSISTEAFLMALRRFVARRGRCSTIYCDNGTNFVGAANILSSLDWKKVIRHGTVNAIEWKFNPPTAAWWGGWWERLIRIMKDLLRKVLGRASLTQEEMTTILCDCEAIINSRPLTYISENDTDFTPISPSMFLKDIKEWSVPDLDVAEHNSLNKRIKYRQVIREDLRKRFRSEYLGQLVQKGTTKKIRPISVGDIVLIGSDNIKRIHWPLGKVLELLPGRDKRVRLVRVKTASSTLLRPVQRIYPLEVTSSAEISSKIMTKCSSMTQTASDTNHDEVDIRYTKSGRKIQVPDRLKF